MIEHALNGDEAALADLFGRYRGRLRKMIDLRLNRLVRARVNPSDVLQEAFIDLADQLGNYAKDPKLPFFVWVRRITGLRLAKIHRTHLDAAKRDASLEVSIYRGRMPQATSHALASKLIGSSTSAASKLEKTEQQVKLQEVFNLLEEDDREVLAMRHFEHLTNSEVASVLEVSEQAASMRHLRAVRRLRAALREFPDWFDDLPVLLEAARTDVADDPESPYEPTR